jgi:hypothetical protein
LVVIGGLLSLGMVLALRRTEKEELRAEIELRPLQPSLPHIESGAEELDRDKLDKSRYLDGS